MNDFQINLIMGQAGESSIARWLRARGCTVLPVYEKIIDNGKGPHLFLPGRTLVAPDLFVFKGSDAFWMEAKHKTAFSWYRIGARWVTGIDIRHYLQYLEVDRCTPWPVWLLFLHQGGQAKDSPADSPSGLFGNTLEFLADNESHRSDKWGKSGMVYWAYSDLKLLATLEQVRQAEGLPVDVGMNIAKAA